MYHYMTPLKYANSSSTAVFFVLRVTSQEYSAIITTGKQIFAEWNAPPHTHQNKQQFVSKHLKWRTEDPNGLLGTKKAVHENRISTNALKIIRSPSLTPPMQLNTSICLITVACWTQQEILQWIYFLLYLQSIKC